MSIDRAVFAFAGIVVLAGLALGWFVNPWFFLIPALAGLNMLQAAFTGSCPAAMVFRAFGCPPGAAFR